MATVDTRYTQDESGQWWYAFDARRRTRARLESCAQCSEKFPTWREQRFCSVKCRSASRELVRPEMSCVECRKRFVPIVKSQRYCSHSCAATAYHARQEVTTQAGGRAIKNIENTRYSVDPRGQWWYTPDGAPRTRAYLKTCAECGQLFLTNIFHQRQGMCSKQCGQIAFHRKNPGANAGEKSGMWKGGRRKDPKGYVLVLAPAHPSLAGTQRRYVQEHRLVMEKKLGRLLTKQETVHHINGIRDDNREENLELWRKSHPPGQRVHEQAKKIVPQWQGSDDGKEWVDCEEANAQEAYTHVRKIWVER